MILYRQHIAYIGVDLMFCTFFGHRQVSNCNEVAPLLYDTLLKLVEERGIKDFLVGDSGAFDRMVLTALRKLSKSNDINYSVVIAYIGTKKNEHYNYRENETVYPDGLEKAPLRFAIDKRNRWMIGKSGIVVTYVNSSIGGSASYAEICEKRGLEVIRLGKL